MNKHKNSIAQGTVSVKTDSVGRKNGAKTKPKCHWAKKHFYPTNLNELLMQSRCRNIGRKQAMCK